MNQSLEVTKKKNESTDSTLNDRMVIKTEMQVEIVKHENNCLVQPEFNMKRELQEDEAEFTIFAGTSVGMCTNYDIKFEKEEPLIKIEYKGIENEITKDPLDVGSEIKDEYFSIDWHDEPRIKTELTDGEENKNLLKTDKDDSQESESNYQDELLVKVYKKKEYVCNLCNKTFRQKCNLEDHLRIHTGAKPFTCDICKKLFNTKGSLVKHMLIHSGEKPYTCDVCRKVFSQTSSLDLHKLIHSGKKSFFCKECNKSFTRKHHLVTHQRIHTGDKPFTCDVCHKAFAHNSSLAEHKRRHTGEKPYSCNVCAISFVSRSNLNRHKKSHKNL